MPRSQRTTSAGGPAAPLKTRNTKSWPRDDRWRSSRQNDIEMANSISSEDSSPEDTENIDYIQAQHSRPRPSVCNRMDMWNRSEVWDQLRELPGGEEIAALIESGDDFAIMQTRHVTTAVLMASWYGCDDILSALLEAGAPADVKDSHGRSALHLAASAGSDKCVNALLLRGAVAACWDASREATPLHCAASAGSEPCVALLLRHGADPNAGLGVRPSPLHYAVRSDACACVHALLQAGASPNTPQVYTETPLHVAAAMGYACCTRTLLSYGADVRVQSGKSKVTALHLAAEDGNAQCTQLLLDSGADLEAVNSRLQTPLHLAALAQSSETVQLLVSRGANTNAVDCDGRTPLHSSIVKGSRSCDCVRLLLGAGAHVNKADNFGYTPLHIAALNEFSHCVNILLQYDGDVTARTNGGISALNFIVRRTPDVLPKFLTQLDKSVRLHDHEIGDVDCELKLDFRKLVPSVERGESGLLLAFIEVGQKHILKHPLCQIFLFLKWKRIRKFFLFSLFFHAVFVLLFSIYVVPSKPNLNSLIPEVHTPIGYILLVFIIILVGKEIFQMAHHWECYMKNWENWLQWLIIIGALVTVIGIENSNNARTWLAESSNATLNSLPHKPSDHWQSHVAAIGIFLIWLELMMLVGRFPMFGLYVQMFTTVSINFSKFLLAYCCLLIAFSLGFGVLFPEHKAFKNTFWTFMKTIVMMSGELEFEDIFYNTVDIKYPVTSHLLFLTFVLLVTVILTNLLVGLAVSDIQGLQQSAGLDRLVRQAQLVSHLESLLFSRLLRWLPKKLLAVCHRSALLITSPYQWSVHIKPNDPRGNNAGLPKELVALAYRMVAERKENSRKRRSKYIDGYLNGSYTTLDYTTFSAPIFLDQAMSQLNSISNDFCKFQVNIEEKIIQLGNKVNNLYNFIKEKDCQC